MAAQIVVTPEIAQAVMRKMTRKALEGDLKAARFMFDHAIGRPVDTPIDAEPVALAIPNLVTAADCSAAIDRVLRAVLQGDVSDQKAEILTEIIKTRLKALEATEHEQRLADLEAQASRAEADRHGSG